MSKEDNRDLTDPEAKVWRIANYFTPVAQQATERGISIEELIDRITLEYKDAKGSEKLEVLNRYFSRIEFD